MEEWVCMVAGGIMGNVYLGRWGKWGRLMGEWVVIMNNWVKAGACWVMWMTLTLAKGRNLACRVGIGG